METNNKLREAVIETQSVIARCMDILNKIPDECGYGGLLDDVADELCALRDGLVKDALAEPVKNCDVGSAQEQENRFYRFCLGRPNCKHCPLVIANSKCNFAWAQMPYVEKEGGAE